MSPRETAASATAGAADAASSAGAPGRLAGIDVVRGAVMVLMAIDHVRVFSGVPAGGPDPAVFFTRWITHFCAPAFVFLAGTSGFLYGRKHPDQSRFLAVRGLWLIVLELTVLRVAWTFNLDFAHYEMAGVVWVIGWGLILLAALSHIPAGAVGGLGLAIIAGHNLLDAVAGRLAGTLDGGLAAALWKIGYIGFFAGPIQGSGGTPSLTVLYSLVPWIGVMAAGYGFGRIVTMEPARRDRICLAIGLGAIALFLVLRCFNLYGDPRPWSRPAVAAASPAAAPAAAPVAAGGPAAPAAPAGTGARPPMPAMLSFLNTTKYPASLDFLLMTLGPTLALLPLAGRARGPVAGALSLFGRVPLFFYLLHIPLIHALALIVSKLRQGAVDPWLFANHPMGNPPPPEGYTWGLPLLYLVWAIAIVILYAACRWYAGVKARRGEGLLRYV